MKLIITRTGSSYLSHGKPNDRAIGLAKKGLRLEPISQPMALAHELGHLKTSTKHDIKRYLEAMNLQGVCPDYSDMLLAYELKAWGWAFSVLPLAEWRPKQALTCLETYCSTKAAKAVAKQFIDKVKTIKAREIAKQISLAVDNCQADMV